MRHENWPERLAAYLEHAAKIGFAWGRNDCLFFAADWLRDITETDPVPDLRGKWRDAASALRALRKTGAASYEDAIRERMTILGYADAKPVALHRGDLCLAMSDNAFGAMLGIVADTRCAFLTESSDAPLLLVPRGSVITGWRIE